MKSARLFEINASPPSYPSSLDRIRTGKQERAAQFGLSDENEESFECNQSFPRALLQTHHSKLSKQTNFTPDLTRMKGYELNSISFLKKNLAKNLNNSDVKTKTNLFNDTVYQQSCYNLNTNANTNVTMNGGEFDKSWAFYNQFINTTSAGIGAYDEENADEIIPVTNPNKALVVINGRTTEILTANNISCELFGYSEEKLIGLKLNKLLDTRNGDDASEDGAKNQDILIELDRLDENGRIVLCSGKIFDAITTITNDEDGVLDENGINQNNEDHLVVPVSMYMLKLTDEQEPKCLCVMEPVQRIVGNFTINLKGRIRYYNSNFSYIFGYTNLNANTSSLSSMTTSVLLNGKDIIDLIPSLKIPMSGISQGIRKQLLTGRTCQMENIPITVQILSKQLYNNEEIVYKCSVSVYTNISGLVTVRPNDFQINSYNSTFARLLLGYNERELLNKPITYLIPNFFEATTSKISNKATPLKYTNENSTSSTKFNNSEKLKLINQINENLLHHDTNYNGSFIETKLGSNVNTTTPKKATIICPLRNEDQDLKSGFKCTNCNRRVRIKLNNECESKKKSNKLNQDLLVDFNLNTECGDYSPNRKCASYIENNSFSPKSASTAPSLSNTPKSAVKKSLLAKAIKNNSNMKSDQAMESPLRNIEESPTSSSASSSFLDESNSSTISDKSIAMSLFSKLEVSEFEENEEVKLTNDNKDTKMEEDIKCDEDIAFEVKKLCNRCRMAENGNNEGNSEMSLIAVDYDDVEGENDGDSVEENNATQDMIDSDKLGGSPNLKRKASDDDLIAKRDEPEKVTENTTESDSINKKFKNQITSTPAQLTTATALLNLNKNKCLLESTNDGIYFGRGRHNDGSLIKLIYQRKNIMNPKNLDENKENKFQSNNNKTSSLICLWLSRDPYSDKSIMECSLDQSNLSQSANLLRGSHLKLNLTLNTCGDTVGSGELGGYLNEYEDLRTLGRGASGFVQLAKRKKLNKFEVVTKYILKSKIYKENWINDSRYGTIPLEISILCKLDHPNIIKVLEVFQDNDHVQMVMEKHGLGMDLFEFIDRQRRVVNECLASYIFRQIVSAVSYLHSNNIVHRDIKDENIVINEKFQIKLIDFGSATFVVHGKKFATFCGTIDYCSPDVLLGNKYFGPELDCWTCGVALYTLVFSENPFFDAEETIECILKPPFKVSKELMVLLFSILCSNPEQRATITEIENNSWVKQSVDITKYKWEEVIRNTEFHGNNAGDCNLEEECANLLIKPMPRVKNLANQENVQLKPPQKESLVSDGQSNNNLKNGKNDERVLINQQNAINLLMSKSF